MLSIVPFAAYTPFYLGRAPRCSVQQYLGEYRQSDGRKTSLLNQAAGHLRRDEEASNSIIITWQISFYYIHRKRQSAADMLSLMNFFNRQGIQEALLRDPSGTIEEDGFEDDVLTLRDYSFITVNLRTVGIHERL
jgi:hypothetical protein